MKVSDAVEFIREAFPIHRSITGKGLLETLKMMRNHIPLNIHYVPTGTQVFDWEVPKEWVVKDAYLEKNGRKIVDYKDNNLHVLGYSRPMDVLADDPDSLLPYLHFGHTLGDPTKKGIPYITSYYKNASGLCMEWGQFYSLKEAHVNGDIYRLVVDSEFKDGFLYYGEAVLPGSSNREFLFSTYCCHPSMVNNELSGPALMMLIYNYIAGLKNRKFTYRFYVGPETLGCLCFVKKMLEAFGYRRRFVGGLVLSQCMNNDRIKYKRTKKESYINKVMEYVGNLTCHDFSPVGSDERQYNSDGIALPVGLFGRGIFCNYPEYHTSFDNLDMIRKGGDKNLEGCFAKLVEVVDIIEKNRVMINIKIDGEPHFSKYGLYDGMSQKEKEGLVWLCSLCGDGTNSILDVAIKSGIEFDRLDKLAALMQTAGILQAVRSF